MDPIVSWKPVIATAIPGISAIMNMILGKRPNLRESASVIGGIITCSVVLSMVSPILHNGIIEKTVFTILPGITVKFRVDGLGLIFACIASFLWILASFYNIGYMRTLKEHAQTRYYTCFSTAIFGALGVALSGNLFTLYLFYEIISIFTYPLVMHHQDDEAYEGARKYIVYLMGTSKLFLLPALVITYVVAGTLDFSTTGISAGIFPKDVSAFIISLTYVLFIFGFAKAAIMPLHNWLPSAMVAPTPVSALLHAVAVVKAGVFSISRVMLSVFGIDVLARFHLGIPTAYFVSFTIILASIIALTKDDLKARLAYSTVSQLSYIVLGVAMLSVSGIKGGLFHIASHAFSKITLFFCAGAIYVAHHKRKISELSGIGWQMPFTIGAFGLASLSMIGVPPVCGFVSKWYLVLGSMETDKVILLIVLLASSLLNAGYFTPIVFKAFFNGRGKVKSSSGFKAGLKEAPMVMVVPLSITAIISVMLGLFPDFFINLIKVLMP